MRNDVDQVHIGVRVESVSTQQERYSVRSIIDYRILIFGYIILEF